MGDIVNLNRARKAQADAQARRTAAANRAKFGRTRAERDAQAAKRARRDALLDGSRIDD